MKETPLDFDFLILNRLPALYSAQRFQIEIEKNNLKGLLISPEDLADFLGIPLDQQRGAGSNTQPMNLKRKVELNSKVKSKLNSKPNSEFNLDSNSNLNSNLNLELNPKLLSKLNSKSLPKILYRQGDYNFWGTQAFLSETNFKIINKPAPFMKARDKWTTYKDWKENNIPTPLSFLAESMLPTLFSAASLESQISLKQDDLFWASQLLFESASELLGRPFILKKRFSSQGRGVFLVHDVNELVDILREDAKQFVLASKLEHQYFCVDSPQSFSKFQFLKRWLFQVCIQESLGQDIRNFHINQKDFTISRTNSNSFRSNLHQGGRASRAVLSATEKSWTDKIQTLSGLHYSGVDFLRTENGPLFLELNPSPGFEGIEYIYENNIAYELLKVLQPDL